MIPWHQNDALFREFCAQGRATENRFADRCRKLGFSVVQPEHVVREHVRDAYKHLNSKDMYVEGLLVEVKGRGFNFTSLEDFQYQEPTIDTVSGFRGKDPKPDVYVCISKDDSGVLWLPVLKTQALWQSISRHDFKRDRRDNFFVADKGLWRELGSLVELFSLAKQGLGLVKAWLAEDVAEPELLTLWD